MLVVAGSLKRSDRDRPEDQVLMRALRDFNIPKIVTDDVPIFMGLIGDLFPSLDVPRKRDMDMEENIRKAILVWTAIYRDVDAKFDNLRPLASRLRLTSNRKRQNSFLIFKTNARFLKSRKLVHYVQT